MAYLSLILAQAQEGRHMGCSDGMGVDAHDMPVGRSHGHESSFAVLTSQESPEWYVEIHDVNGQGKTHVTRTWLQNSAEHPRADMTTLRATQRHSLSPTTPTKPRAKRIGRPTESTCSWNSDDGGAFVGGGIGRSGKSTTSVIEMFRFQGCRRREWWREGEQIVKDDGR